MISELLQTEILVPWLLGMVFGVFVGATPGLTATMAVALIVPVSFYLDPNAGLAMIIGVSFTAIFSGDIPATYLRIPGTPASAAATLDGHEMARRGEGDTAMMLDLVCSCLGGLIGVGLLIVVARPLASFALRFSDFEYFWLGLLGLGLSALVSRGHTFKGVLSATLGVLLSTVGMDVVSGAPRYTFEQVELLGGLHFIPVMIGLFGLAEVLRNVRDGVEMAAPSVRRSAGPASQSADLATSGSQSARTSVSRLLRLLRSLAGSTARLVYLAVLQPIGSTLRLLLRYPRLILQSALAGTVIGALPGAGADIAAWGAYGLAQKTSRKPDAFGTGSVEGVIAPTSANNAAVAGAWIPALVFGVPGDAVTAIVLGAMMMYDITPGPQLFEQQGGPVQAIFTIALVTQFLLLPAGFAGIKAFGWILRLPRRLVLTSVIVFSLVGAYALQNSWFDVGVMVAFGAVGYFLETQRVPLAPLILGLILGELIEKKLRAGLISASGDWTVMFTRPICVMLVTILVVAVVGGPLWRLITGGKAKDAAR